MIEQNLKKTVEFSEGIAGKKKKEILRLNLEGVSREISARIHMLSSKEIVSILGISDYTQLKHSARVHKASLSSFVLGELEKKIGGNGRSKNSQIPLFKEEVPTPLPYETAAGTLSQIGTFRVNKESPIHRWYPYVEGFSADRIVGLLKSFLPRPDMKVYDPFGGSGTVQALASHLGYESYFSELNPVMQLVCEIKVNLSRECFGNKRILEELEVLREKIQKIDLERVSKNQDATRFHGVFGGRDYFIEKDLLQILFLLNLPSGQFWTNPAVKRFSDFAVYCIAVDCSNMTRRADLRRRRADEYKNRVVNVQSSYLKKLTQIIEDICVLPKKSRKTVKINDSCLDFNEAYEEKFDLILTSPPYLNGTNYFRNTKIELGLAGLIDSESDLTGFCTDSITAGINNVSERNRTPKKFEFVEKVAREVEKKTYDQRIQKMIRCYFSDMSMAADNYYRYLRKGGHFICDIGDSVFAGVHVPTHTLLEKTFAKSGFELIESNFLRQRYSLNKAKLGQYELVFRKK